MLAAGLLGLAEAGVDGMPGAEVAAEEEEDVPEGLWLDEDEEELDDEALAELDELELELLGGGIGMGGVDDELDMVLAQPWSSSTSIDPVSDR